MLEFYKISLKEKHLNNKGSSSVHPSKWILILKLNFIKDLRLRTEDYELNIRK